MAKDAELTDMGFLSSPTYDDEQKSQFLVSLLEGVQKCLKPRKMPKQLVDPQNAHHLTFLLILIKFAILKHGTIKVQFQSQMFLSSFFHKFSFFQD